MTESILALSFVARIFLSAWTYFGAIKTYNCANDFLSHISKHIRKANEEIWFVGTNFFSTAPTHKDLLVEKLRDGVDIKFLIFDFLDPSLSRVAASFSNSEGEFCKQCESTVESLLEIHRSWEQMQGQSRGQLDIRLSGREPKIRLYFFDRRRFSGHTYFVPHVAKWDSPKLPGFLVRNIRRGIVSTYAAGVQQLWEESQQFMDWLPKFMGQAKTPERHP